MASATRVNFCLMIGGDDRRAPARMALTRPGLRVLNVVLEGDEGAGKKAGVENN